MTFSDGTPLGEASNPTPVYDSPANEAFATARQAQSSTQPPDRRPAPKAEKVQVLPAWSAALPLWASDHWLWLVQPNRGPVRHWTGVTGQILATGQAPTLAQLLPSTISYSLIILDCRSMRKLPDEWWPRLEGLLAPGGLLLICCPRDKHLSEEICASASELRPSNWHVIEPGQEGHWHLRPASSSMRRIALELNPPYTTRVWLTRILHRWLPQRLTINCLPVWRSRVLG